MTDVYDREKRSWLMSRVRSRGNQSTEKRFIKLLREHRITGWRRNYPLLGNPDFCFPAAGVAVFVDGCFWHGCPKHGQIPKTNRKFWQNKIARNAARDRYVSAALRRDGWHVHRFWEHELRGRLINRKLGRLKQLLRRQF